LDQNGESLTDYHHSPKLVALRQLLLECGIGTHLNISNNDDDDIGNNDDIKKGQKLNDDDDETDDTIDDGAMDEVVVRHRVLIFAQVRFMLCGLVCEPRNCD
jgi:hypothetical protein